MQTTAKHIKRIANVYLRPKTYLLASFLMLTGCSDSSFVLLPSNSTDAARSLSATQSLPDLEQIQDRGYFTAVVDSNLFSLYGYKGELMGYEYELLNWLGEDLNVQVRYVVEKNHHKARKMLQSGEVDVIAYPFALQQQTEQVAFTAPLYTSRQVLVQRKDEQSAPFGLIKEPYELNEQVVHVTPESTYLVRLQNLSEEIGGSIHIDKSSKQESSTCLIEDVAKKNIDYTLAFENIARLYASQYQNLDVSTPVGFEQHISWMLRKSSNQLRSAIDKWIEKNKGSVKYRVIYNKYFKAFNGIAYRTDHPLSTLGKGQLSRYDNQVRFSADRLGWDWRLLGALIFQESAFDPNARSWQGAKGLMQIMPATYRTFGKNSSSSSAVAGNIHTGVNYMNWLNKLWKRHIPEPQERLKFILASYNAGQGHILDARRLARKYGHNPNNWNDVAYFLRRMNRKVYYQDEVVRYGYTRGAEPVHYVATIMNRYNTYRQIYNA